MAGGEEKNKKTDGPRMLPFSGIGFGLGFGLGCGTGIGLGIGGLGKQQITTPQKIVLLSKTRGWG